MPRPRLDRHQRGVLACTVSASAVVFFDQTAVTVALPVIGREFAADADELQWTITIYLLALAAFMLLAGGIADHYGRRRVFLGGLAVFGLGSALCALAPSFGMLLVGRFVQGLGGAVVVPLALSATTRAVEGPRRGWAIGVLATGGTSLLVLGPVLAGALLAAGWRWLFLVNLPVVAFALVTGARCISASREAEPRPVDWRGAGLLLVGLSATMAGVVGFADLGVLALVPLAAGLLVLGVFVGWERGRPRPLLAVALLAEPTMAGSLSALFAIQFAVFGVTVSLALYLQHGLGLDALRSGLVIAAAGLGTPLLSATTGRLADRHGPRALVLPGLLLAVTGLVAVALLARHGAVALLPGLLLFALARPMVFTPAGSGTFQAVDAERRALAAGLATESRQLGAVLGVALTTAALALTHGTTFVDGDRELVVGFQAAVLVAAVVCMAAVPVVQRMPAARRTGSHRT